MSNYFEKANEYVSNTEVAIQLLLDQHLHSQALTLLYSLIDTISYLCMPSEKYENTRSDFLDWSNEYIMPFIKYKLTSKDLYAARCSILHSGTSESRLIRNGEASQIFYAWGNKLPDQLQNSIDEHSDFFPFEKKPIVIPIDYFFKAVMAGWKKYQGDLLKEESKYKMILDSIKQRSGKLFKNSLWD